LLCCKPTLSVPISVTRRTTFTDAADISANVTGVGDRHGRQHQSCAGDSQLAWGAKQGRYLLLTSTNLVDLKDQIIIIRQ